MKPGALREITFHRQRSGGDLPLELRGQPCAGPAGESVGFVVANVADRLGLFNLAPPRAGELEPLTPIFFPIERRYPSVRLHGLPPVRQPELGAFIASVRHKSQILPAGGWTRSKTEGRQKHFMPGSLVVKVE